MNILCVDTSGRVLNFSILRLPEISYPTVCYKAGGDTDDMTGVEGSISDQLDMRHSVVDVLKGELQINPEHLSSDCIPLISNYTVALGNKFVKRLDVGGKMNETLFSTLNLFLEECELQAKDIDEWVCILGPGSLTGIRIGLAALSGITVGLGKPLYGLSAFDAASLIHDIDRGSLVQGADINGDNLDIVTVCARLRQMEYACRSYDYIDGSSTDVTIEELVELDDFAGRLLINSGNNSSAGIYLSEAIFHSKARGYYMEPTPMYIRRSEAELNFDKSSNKR